MKWNRRFRRLTLFLGLALFMIVAVALTVFTSDAAQGGGGNGAVGSLLSTAVSITNPNYGVVFINSAEDLADEERFENGLATGAGWDRYPLYWFYIETSEGVFDWSRQDTAVQATIDHGMQLDAILLGTPAFYTTNLLQSPPLPYDHPDRGGELVLNDVERATPEGLFEPVFTDGDTPGPDKVINPDNKWAVFVETAVNRYKPGGVLAQANSWPEGQGVSMWEMWNEADLPFFWDAGLSDYARLLKVGYLATKHADPAAQVMVGGLAMWQTPDYYEQVLDVYDGDPLAPGNGFFHDVVAIHNYTHPERSGIYVDIMNDAMAGYGLQKEVWLNESGVPAWDDYPGPVWEPLSPLRATQEEMAAFAVQSAFFALYAGADGLFHFQLYDGCGNQPVGTDFPPHNGELCDENNEYNGKPCAGDAYGLYRNPTDAACFSQHPQPESPRPATAAYQVLTSYVTDVEPYWRERVGSPIFTSTCPWSDGTQEWVALYQPASKKRIVGLWARCENDETAVIEATDPNGVATLAGMDGSVQEITAENGFYAISLPRATHRNPFPGQDINPVFTIGGRPSILIETDYKGDPPTPTATPTSTMTASATATATFTATATATPTATTTATATATATPSGPSTHYLPALLNDAPFGIVGRITDANGNGVVGVLVNLDGDIWQETDADGVYAFNYLAPGTYIIRPVISEYIFRPQIRIVTVPPTAAEQNFTAVPFDPYPGPE